MDYLADDDFERIGAGDRLSRLYDLVMFPGHEEYVTTHAYDVLKRYRHFAGTLAFFSANNVFHRVERRGRRLVRTGRWRDLVRSEAALAGVQYLRWNENRYRSAPYVVVGRQHATWLFRETSLRNGDRSGSFGIEIDAQTSDSPRGTRVLARIPEVFGRGRSAEMTYYMTPWGAKVFAAGAFTSARRHCGLPSHRCSTTCGGSSACRETLGADRGGGSYATLGSADAITAAPSRPGLLSEPSMMPGSYCPPARQHCWTGAGSPVSPPPIALTCLGPAQPGAPHPLHRTELLLPLPTASPPRVDPRTG